MQYCKRCVQPDTRPGIKFGEEMICPACQYAEKLSEVDWEARKQELLKLVEAYKQHNKSEYDCIIGVSGGKDSTRQAMYVKNELGMKPLLVSCTYPPEQQTERGAHNLSNLISLGFDTISISPDPVVWKKLMRQGFLKYGNWAKSTEMALYACLPRIATAYHIPLIFLGENPATQMGDLTVGSMTWDGTRMKYTNTIAGGPDSLLSGEITEQDLIWYRYPSDQDLERANIKIVYLGYFWKDFTKIDNAGFSIAHGLEIRQDSSKNMGTLGLFEALDEDFVFVNQMMKYLKFGFGKVTDEACEMIRYGRLTREEAVKLVNKYDGRCSSKYIQKFCDYIGITTEKFWEVAESYRNQNLWTKDKNNRWVLKFPLK